MNTVLDDVAQSEVVEGEFNMLVLGALCIHSQVEEELQEKTGYDPGELLGFLKHLLDRQLISHSIARRGNSKFFSHTYSLRDGVELAIIKQKPLETKYE